MADRAAIVEVGSLRKSHDGRWRFKGWLFDAIIAGGVRPITVDEHGELTHVAGWPVEELQSLSRDYLLLRFGLVRPEDFE